MNIFSLLLKRLRRMVLAAMLVPMLTACPLMMAMMVPMHGGGLHGGGEQGEKKIAQELVEEGVVALAANHGSYQTLVVGQVSVQDVTMSPTEFRGLTDLAPEARVAARRERKPRAPRARLRGIAARGCFRTPGRSIVPGGRSLVARNPVGG